MRSAAAQGARKRSHARARSRSLGLTTLRPRPLTPLSSFVPSIRPLHARAWRLTIDPTAPTSREHLAGAEAETARLSARCEKLDRAK